MMDKAIFKRKELDAFMEIKSPQEIQKIKPQYDKEIDEIKKDINEIKGVPENSDIFKNSKEPSKKMEKFEKLKELYETNDSK